MTIYQPRRDNVSTYEISKDELYRWADEVLKPTADLAFAGDGNFLCGEWCGFCTQVFINHSYYNQSQLGVYVNGQAYWSYKGKPITNFLSAAYAAFELVDPVSRIMG